MRNNALVTPPTDTSNVIQLPSFYVDAAQINRQPFTVQVVLGKLDMGNRVAPSLHLTLSPGFCQRLGEMLLAAAAGSDAE
jgi:hypothetical protein